MSAEAQLDGTAFLAAGASSYHLIYGIDVIGKSSFRVFPEHSTYRFTSPTLEGWF